MQDSISEYFYQTNQNDPTYFDWEYILIDNKKLKMLGVCLEVKLLFIQVCLK